MFELYSRRNRNIEDDPDVFEYDVFSRHLRNQLYYIFEKEIDEAQYSSVIVSLHKFLLIEMGQKRLSIQGWSYERQDLEDYWEESNPSDFIDLLDACVHFLYKINLYTEYHPNHTSFEEMKANVNARLKRANLGYEIISDKLVRIDNMFMHATIVKPTLSFLYQNDFKGTENEIYSAFDYLKDEDYKNTVLYAAKAFESMMKTICSNKNFMYKKDKDTAKELIRILVENNYIPNYLENHLHAVRTTLECGLPTLRNKTSGHGQGDEIVEIPEAFAKYALNLACTNILFLAELS